MNELDRMKKLAGILTESVMAVPGVGQESNEIDEMFDKLSEELDPSEESLIHRYMAGEIDREEFMQQMDSFAATDHSMRQGEMGMQGDDTPQGNRAWDREQSDWAGMDEPEDEYDEIGEAAPVDEKAPPGMEDMVMKLKKQYPGHEEKAFATAWSIYNKKNGKTEESGPGMVDEGGDLESTIQQKTARAQELMSGMVEADQAVDIICDELTQEGFGPEEITSIIDSIAEQLGKPAGYDDGTSAEIDFGADQELGAPEEMFEDAEKKVDEAFDLNNGYDDIQFMKPGDFFPDGADSPVTATTGAAGAKQGDNPEQKKMAVAETHKELVYNYRKFLKESSKK